MGRGRKGTGVEPRANDYRIRFTWNGTRYAIPVALKPCAPHFLAVKKQAAEVQRAIESGTFKFERFFPDSPHAPKVPPAEVATFEKYAKRWRESRGALSHGMKIKDRLAVEFWAKKIGGTTDMAKVVPSELAATVGGHPWAGAKYRNNMLIALRGVFAMWAADDPRNRVSPVEGIKNQAVQKGKPDPFTLEEVELILADMASHYDERVVAYYEAAFFAGFRPEEEIALKWAKIDGRKRVGRVDVAKYRTVEKSTKNYEVRDVEFNDRAWAAIERMRAWTGLKDNERGHGHVFENPKTGKPWASEADQRDLYWTPTLKRLRLRHRVAYQTRSTCATMMLLGRQDPNYCARQLGHSLQVFWEKYATWINGARNEQEREKMNAMLRRAAAGE